MFDYRFVSFPRIALPLRIQLLKSRSLIRKNAKMFCIKYNKFDIDTTNLLIFVPSVVN